MMKIADVLEKNLNLLATAECLDNGKPIRECMAADLPLVIDHWRYFAGVIRAEEGSVAEISNSQYSYNCLLYTSPSPRDRTRSRMPSSA